MSSQQPAGTQRQSRQGRLGFVVTACLASAALAAPIAIGATGNPLKEGVRNPRIGAATRRRHHREHARQRVRHPPVEPRRRRRRDLRLPHHRGLQRARRHDEVDAMPARQQPAQRAHPLLSLRHRQRRRRLPGRRDRRERSDRAPVHHERHRRGDRPERRPRRRHGRRRDHRRRAVRASSDRPAPRATPARPATRARAARPAAARSGSAASAHLPAASATRCPATSTSTSSLPAPPRATSTRRPAPRRGRHAGTSTGRPGRPPTPAEIQSRVNAAVAAYCGSPTPISGRCGNPVAPPAGRRRVRRAAQLLPAEGA